LTLIDIHHHLKASSRDKSFGITNPIDFIEPTGNRLMSSLTFMAHELMNAHGLLADIEELRHTSDMLPIAMTSISFET